MSKLRIVVVENDPLDPVGRLGEHLAPHDVVTVRPQLGDGFPQPDTFDASVVLGGRMGAHETSKHPWLKTEIEWMGALVEADRPTLGICLGSQLLAAATGGRAFPAASSEVGVVKLLKTEAAPLDPVFSVSGDRVLAIHFDTFELGKDAVLLAESDRFPHAFRVGAALAVQFHPETGGEQAIEWLTNPDNRLRRGLDEDELAATLDEIREVDPERRKASDRLFARWIETVEKVAS